MSDSKNRRKSRRSFVPDNFPEDGPEVNCFDNEKMDVDKGTSEDDSWKDLHKLESYVRSRHKEYKQGLKDLLKSQQEQSSKMLLNLDGQDYEEYLTASERDFFFEAKKVLGSHKFDVSEFEIQKMLIENIKMKQELNRNLRENVKIAEFIAKEASITADITSVKLPVFVNVESGSEN